MSFENRDLSAKKSIEGSKFREEVFSKAVRAGKRTYFFDVKRTRSNELYLTITESKKINGNIGRTFYEKHKIFLYKEDFEKFVGGLDDMINYIKMNQPSLVSELDSDFDYDNEDAEEEDDFIEDDDFSNIEFEDLSRK